MNVSVTREGNDAALKIAVTAAEVDKSFKQAVARIANQVRIPGFRPGKAPRNIIEMHYGKAAVKEEAFNICVNRAYQQAIETEKLMPVAIETEKLMPVSDPEVKDEKKAFEEFAEGKDFEVDVAVVLKPEPELGEYKGIHVDKKEAKVSDEDVDKALEELRNRGAKMVDTDDETVIEKGDFAIIDFAGTVDGEAFSGGEGKGYPLEVGSGSFMKKDDDTDVDVTFPESYFVPELAGKQAIFKVHIQAVKHKELPELNDEYIAKYTRYKTVAEAKEDYKKHMQEAAERDAKTEYENALIDTAVNNAKMDVPPVMIEDRITQMVEEIKLNLESRKMTLDQYMQYTGMDMAKLREAQREGAEKNVRTDLVLDAIAKAENIQVDMADVDAQLQSIADQNGARLEDVKTIIRKNNNMGLLLANILRHKAAHVILDNAK